MSWNKHCYTHSNQIILHCRILLLICFNNSIPRHHCAEFLKASCRSLSLQHTLNVSVSTQHATSLSLKMILYIIFNNCIKLLTVPLEIMKHNLAVQNKLDSLRWFSQRHSRTPHFWGCATRAYDPQIRTRKWFFYNAPTPKFHHPMFTRSEVIALTNKDTNTQTDATRNIQCSSLCYDFG